MQLCMTNQTACSQAEEGSKDAGAPCILVLESMTLCEINVLSKNCLVKAVMLPLNKYLQRKQTVHCSMMQKQAQGILGAFEPWFICKSTLTTRV